MPVETPIMHRGAKCGPEVSCCEPCKMPEIGRVLRSAMAEKARMNAREPG